VSVADEFLIRPIQASDDAAVASVIRTVMPEFGAKGPGFAINDPEVDHMSQAYAGERARYWVIERNGEVVGGGGFAQLTGADAGTCELRKMYFLPSARGAGLGKKLLSLCMREASFAGYHQMYLETLENMHAARRLYEAFGFRPLAKPKGATGHFGCDAWYERAL
jgi:putative acetyltransferase